MRFVLVLALAPAACATHAPPSEPVAETWRVVSYNIHHGAGLDGRIDLERIAAVLRQLDPDVVALQEVDQGVERTGREDQARRLGELLDMQHVFGAFMDYQGGRYGMAILSRCDIRAVHPVRLPDGNEPRIALTAELRASAGSVTVVNVHFDWVADDAFRFAQAQHVARFIDTLPGPYVLAGDFNDLPDSRTLSLFRARASEATKTGERTYTFSADDPRREIDFIFVSREDGWTAAEVDVVEERVASDHLPVVAELVRREPAGPAVPVTAGRPVGQRVPACPR